MTGRRTTRVATLACFGAAALACSARQLATESSLDRAPAPSAALAAEPPGGRLQAPAGATPVALREPIPTEAARRLVVEFFRVMVSGSNEELEQLFADGVRGGRHDAAGLAATWIERRRSLDYGALVGERVIDPARVRVESSPSADAVELAVRVERPTLGKQRYFADELSFRVERQAQGLRISRVGESSDTP